MSYSHDTTSTRISSKVDGPGNNEELLCHARNNVTSPITADRYDKQALSVRRASWLIDTGSLATVPGGVMKFALRCCERRIGMTDERISQSFDHKLKVQRLMSPWQTREGANANAVCFKSECHTMVS